MKTKIKNIFFYLLGYNQKSYYKLNIFGKDIFTIEINPSQLSEMD